MKHLLLKAILKFCTNKKLFKYNQHRFLLPDDLRCLQGFFLVKLDKTPGPNFMHTELIFHDRATLES